MSKLIDRIESDVKYLETQYSQMENNYQKSGSHREAYECSIKKDTVNHIRLMINRLKQTVVDDVDEYISKEYGS